MGQWFIDTPGIGSLIVMGVAGSVLLAYAGMLRWILTAPRDAHSAPEVGEDHA